MFSAKKIIIIALIAIVLIAIPVTVYLLQQQQTTQSQAQDSSTLSFTPPSSVGSPIQAKLDDPVDLDLYLDPGSNAVSFVRLEIQYDSTKLATMSGVEGAFEKNATAFPSTREGPKYLDGKILVSLSIDSNLTNPIRARTKIGTIHFKAIAKTDTPTQVLYATTTQVLSVAGPDTGSPDSASEDVLLSSTPAVIAIVGPVETPTPTPTATIPPEEPTPTLTIAPDPTNVLPICVTFSASPSNCTAPLDTIFSVHGSDSDGIVKSIALNFGDGNVASLSGDQLTASASALHDVTASVEHTYSTGGTFTASAVMTDDRGGTSTGGTCTQIITVAGPSATPSAATATPTPTSILVADTATPTIASPGPGATIIGLGAFFSVLSVIGAILFFAL